MRELEIGLITEATSFAEVAHAVERAHGEALEEREGLNIGGEPYFSNFRLPLPDPEYQLIQNYSQHEREWRYDDHRDIPFVLRVVADDADIDQESLLNRLSAVKGQWRVIEA
jgi:hypothetical protein